MSDNPWMNQPDPGPYPSEGEAAMAWSRESVTEQLRPFAPAGYDRHALYDKVILPQCPITELPRILCGCGNSHCDSFTMTDEERAYLDGQHGPLILAADNPSRVKGTYEHLVKPLPEYRSVPWVAPRDVQVADSTILCRACGKYPSGDAFVCNPCIDDLEVALGDVPAVLADLDVQITRQARVSRYQRPTKRAEHTRWDGVIAETDYTGENQAKLLASRGFNRLPYTQRASVAKDQLVNELVTTVRMLCEHRGLEVPQIDTEGCSRWLLTYVQSIALDIGGPDCVVKIVACVRTAKQTIDNDPDREYIGLCDKCQAGMYAIHNRAEHRCNTCGETYDVAGRLEQIRARVGDQLLTVGQLVRYACSGYAGHKINRHRVNRMIAKGRLVTHGSNRDGDALYRADDLLVILEEEAS